MLKITLSDYSVIYAKTIGEALENGKKVYWINSTYKVFLDNGKLYEINTYNASMCGLQESQYKDCFVEAL